MILVDTSVWIDHFRRGCDELVELLERSQVLTHPFVVGELACGSLAKRRETLSLLDLLPRVSVANDAEARHLLENRGLSARGLGWVDIHLLASAQLDAVQLWTRDRALLGAAAELGRAAKGER